MKKKRVDPSEIVRLNPSLDSGLTKEQVASQTEKGLINKPTKKVEKSVILILLQNFFGPFNLILYAVAVFFSFFMAICDTLGYHDIVMEEFGFSKFLFLIPAIINSIIGSIQEINGKRVLSKLRLLNQAKAIVIRDGERQKLVSQDIVLDDVLVLSAGEQCLADCILGAGSLYVDEGLLTGESDAIQKKPGDLIYAGSSIVAGEGEAIVERIGDDTYAAGLQSKVRELPRHRSELMVSINKIIRVLAFILIGMVVLVTVTMVIKIHVYDGEPYVFDTSEVLSLTSMTTWARIILTTGAFCVGIIPEGLVLLASVALAISVVRLAKEKTLIQELYSLENLSRVDVICLDKTGTLTDGTMAVIDTKYLIDEDSVVSYVRSLLGAFDSKNATATALAERFGSEVNDSIVEKFPFSSKTKKSGVAFANGDRLFMGAPEYLGAGDDSLVREQSKQGNRVVALALNDKPIAFFVLSDHIRASAKDTLAYFYENHVDVRIISGDNLFTVAKIAEQCGVKNTDKAVSLEGVPLEDIPALVKETVIFARVSPEQKLAIVEALQSEGHKVAMTGDGVNDILALRKSDASITFGKATDAAKSCADVVLLDNDFSHLKEVVAQGRRVVNNIERSATLFLMKTVAIICLAVGLAFFPKGQMWYSVENLYLMQTPIIGIGGFLLSLENHKEPVRGTFRENVLRKAILSGALVAFAALIPLIFRHIYVDGTSIISYGNAKSLISILTALAGFVACVALTSPWTKYRVVVLFAILAVAVLMAFAMPTTVVGGKATTAAMFQSPDEYWYHAPFFQEFFQPQNSFVMQDLGSDWKNFALMGAFLVLFFPSYILLYRYIFRKDKKKKAQ